MQGSYAALPLVRACVNTQLSEGMSVPAACLRMPRWHVKVMDFYSHSYSDKMLLQA